MKNLFGFIFLFLCCIPTLEAQTTTTLQLQDIMKGDDFVGYLPDSIRWSEDSKEIYFSWNPDRDPINSKYKVEVANKSISKRSVEELKRWTEDGVYNNDFSKKVYQLNGDIFLLNTKNNSVKQITNTLAKESKPVFSGDQKAVIFKSNNNLFTWSISDGSLKQLTDFKSGQKRDAKINPQEQWLEQDQLDMFVVLRNRKAEKEIRKYRDSLTAPDRPKSIYLGNKSLSGMWATPNLNYVIYQIYAKANTKKTRVPDYVSQSGYTANLSARSKVGGPQKVYEFWIYDIKNDSIYQIKTDNLEGVFKKPQFMKDYAKDPATYKETYDEPKPVKINKPIFSNQGDVLLNISSQDNKDRWITTLDMTNGELSQVDHQHDEAWIAGPGVSWNTTTVLGWIDNEHIYFQSEVTGYSHLYMANIKTGNIKALTQGDFEIISAVLSKDKKTFFITSNQVSPHEHHFYHLPVKGGKMTQITSLKGGHEVTVSPDEKYLAIRYSYSNKPWELFLMPNKPGAQMVQLTHSTTKAFESYPWRDPSIIQIEARDGALVPATLYEPPANKKNGAAVIFVHGAGYLQNVHHWWPSYYREFMFNNLLADQGYTVLALDFRASRGYGRDWRTAIYRHMGGKDLSDQVDGAKYLVEKQNIDKDRIGIYGGSYGGFITLMAMFKESETFKSGAALRSVADWAHYNHGYTSNILNTPVEDSLAYAQSSPIYFADGLKGNLLMLHGMIDTNVQIQDVIRLSQRLIELGKKNWDLAVFPLEDHGFKTASGWTDEYRRIYDLFNRTLLEN